VRCSGQLKAGPHPAAENFAEKDVQPASQATAQVFVEGKLENQEQNRKEDWQRPDAVGQDLVDPVGAGQIRWVLAMLQDLAGDAGGFLVQDLRFFIRLGFEIERQ